jgi:hypothetical protein
VCREQRGHREKEKRDLRPNPFDQHDLVDGVLSGAHPFDLGSFRIGADGVLPSADAKKKKERK